jgi:hypothetical protein
MRLILAEGNVMRPVFALAVLAGSVALAQDPGPPRDPDPRFGVKAKVKSYPQDTAKKALRSAIEAAEAGEYAYLVAHLLDPAFVNQRLADRAKQFETGVELELANLRDFQIRNPDRFAPEDRLPADRARFNALVVQRSRERAFKQLANDVSDKLRDDPQALRDLKKILREGTFEDTPTGAKATHPDVKDQALFFRKIDDRWFLENRQEDLPGPKKPEDPPKKDPGA